MADENNNRSGGSGGLSNTDPFINIAAAIIIFLLLSHLAQTLPTVIADMWASVSGSMGPLGGIYTGSYIIAVGFVSACIFGTAYAFMQKSRVVAAEKRELESLTQAAIAGESTQNERWQRILSYAASDDEELWRLAIIDADVMMDEMLESMGYPQDSLGEKLKSVEESDFRTLNRAWEAHKLRNTIAHKGSTYDLTRRELDAAINNYRQVFNEFSYI